MVLNPNSSLRSRLTPESFFVQEDHDPATANALRTDEGAEALADEVWARIDHAAAMKSLLRERSGTSISKERLWTALESVSDGFAVFDMHGRMVAANPAFLAPFEGMRCVKLGITYADLVDIAIEEGLVDPGCTDARDWVHWMKRRWNTRTIPPITVRFWSNQVVRLIERRTPSGDVVMLGINITRQVRRQQMLEAAKRRAEATSARFTAMSHEVCTAMSEFRAIADLIDADDLTEVQRRHLETMRGLGASVLRTVNDAAEATAETPSTNVVRMVAPAAAIVASDQPTEPELRRMRVLCAEDNKTNRLIIRKLLKTLDIDLKIVENGRQALRAFRAEIPDIVFTDVSMPEMDGRKLAQSLRRFTKKMDLPKVPVIAMTAHSVDRHVGKDRAAGIDHYLTKPLQEDLLIEYVAAAAPKDVAPPVSETADRG